MVEQVSGVLNSAPVLTKGNQISLDKQPEGQSFQTVLKTALDEVSKVENESDVKTELLAQGKIDDLHDVMITAQKATITVETAVQVQQKAIDIYNEMMRMQV